MTAISDRPTTFTARSADLEWIERNPPAVHGAAPGGVWKTAPEAYRFLAEHVPADAVTLETGLGVSTVLFGMWSAQHTCVVASADEVAAVTSFATANEIAFDHVSFEVGTSDVVLPALDLAPIDVFLIDGGHGFPHPAIDWYYGARTLKDGGIVVIDDVQLPAVHDHLVTVLDADPRWEHVGGDWRWRAYRKLGDFPLGEEWTNQPFLGEPRFPMNLRAKRLVKRLLTPGS
jgi:hypothetical protein